MTPAARVAAAIEIADSILAGQATEAALIDWARRHRFAGAKDRAAIRDLVFEARRRWRSAAARGGAETGRAILIGSLAQGQGQAALEPLFDGHGYGPAPLTPDERTVLRSPPAMPEAVRADLPDWLWAQLVQDHGSSAAADLAETLRNRAPVFVRVNLARRGRAEAARQLQAEGIAARPAPASPSALEVTEGARLLHRSAAYLDGVVELQDAQSQAVVDALGVGPGMRVLDYCAGGGGKALAMAACGAQVTAHDVSAARMGDISVRAARAGVQIACIAPPHRPARAGFDLVLCDAPCSGSGAWRRSPDGKWALTPEALSALARTQADVLAEAIGHVAPGGRLAYVTCSILRAENDAAVSAFVTGHSGWEVTQHRSWWPGPEGDGFFLAMLQKRDS